MSYSGKYFWWMKRKEIDAGQLRQALIGKQPFLLPFLSLCGLTIPKHPCWSACQGGLCSLQNTQYHHEQQATKTSPTEGWQHLPPEELRMLESLGNQGGVGWDHCSLKDTGQPVLPTAVKVTYKAHKATLLVNICWHKTLFSCFLAFHSTHWTASFVFCAHHKNS